MFQKILRPLLAPLFLTASFHKGLSMKKRFFQSSLDIKKILANCALSENWFALKDFESFDDQESAIDFLQKIRLKQHNAAAKIQRTIRRTLREIHHKKRQQQEEERLKREKKREEAFQAKKYQDFLQSYYYFLDAIPPHLNHLKYFFYHSYDKSVFDLEGYDHDKKMIFSSEDNLILFDDYYFHTAVDLKGECSPQPLLPKPSSRQSLFFNSKKIAYDDTTGKKIFCHCSVLEKFTFFNNQKLFSDEKTKKKNFCQCAPKTTLKITSQTPHNLHESKIYNFLHQHNSFIIEEDFFNEINKHSIDTHRGMLQKILLKLMWALWENDNILHDFLSIVDFHDDNIRFGDFEFYEYILQELSPEEQNLFLNHFVTDKACPFQHLPFSKKCDKYKLYRDGYSRIPFKKALKQILPCFMEKILEVSDFLKKNLSKKEYEFLSLHIFDYCLLETIFDDFAPHNIMNIPKKQYCYHDDDMMTEDSVRINLFKDGNWKPEDMYHVQDKITLPSKNLFFVCDPQFFKENSSFVTMPQFFSKKYVMKSHTLQREDNELFFEDLQSSHRKNVEVVRKDFLDTTYEEAKEKFIEDFNKKFIQPLSNKHFILFYSDFSDFDSFFDFIKKNAYTDRNKYFAVDIFSSILSVLFGHDPYDHFIMKYYFMLNARCPFAQKEQSASDLNRVNREGVLLPNYDSILLFMQEEIRRLFVQRVKPILQLRQQKDILQPRQQKERRFSERTGTTLQPIPIRQEGDMKKIFSDINTFCNYMRSYNLPIFFRSVQNYFQRIMDKNNHQVETFVNEYLRKIENTLPRQIQNLSYIIFLMDAQVALSEKDFKKKEDDFKQKEEYCKKRDEDFEKKKEDLKKEKKDLKKEKKDFLEKIKQEEELFFKNCIVFDDFRAKDEDCEQEKCDFLNRIRKEKKFYFKNDFVYLNFQKNKKNFLRRTLKEHQPCFNNELIAAIFGSKSRLKFYIFEFLEDSMGNIYKIISYYQNLEGEEKKAVEKALKSYVFGIKKDINHSPEAEIMIYNIVNALAAPYVYGHEKIDYYFRLAVTPLVPYIIRVIKIIYGLPKDIVVKAVEKKANN